jgi:Na+/H+ antiporter NhaA
MLEVLDTILFVLLVILEVLLFIRFGKVAIVEELMPPTLTTVGAEAVPPKSFVNFKMPFVDASASGMEAPLATKDAFTNAVVAI